MQDQERPEMWDWYGDFYAALPTSKAHSEMCRRVFGRDLSQHGFSDMAQLDRLIEVLALRPGDRVLDLGCGNGGIAAHICDCTGAHVTGVDYIPEAIRQAEERTQDRRDRLAFRVMSIDCLDFPAAAFDALISIDTLYFTDLDPTLEGLKRVVRPGGQMGIFYSHGVMPWEDAAAFPRETLQPATTPLGAALTRQGLAFRAWDFTQADYELARVRKHVVEELREQFEAEGNRFIYENRRGDSDGTMAAVEQGAHSRYLYHVRR